MLNSNILPLWPIRLNCQLSRTRIPPLLILWLPILSLFFLPNSPPIPSYTDHTIRYLNYLSEVLPSHPTFHSPTSSCLSNTISGKATCSNQCNCSFPVFLYLGCCVLLEIITQPYKLRVPKIHGLYHQLLGSLSMNPGSSYSSQLSPYSVMSSRSKPSDS